VRLSLLQPTIFYNNRILTSPKKQYFSSLSFREVNYVKVFGEYEYELLPDDEETKSLIQKWGASLISRAYEGHNGDHETDEAEG
jgi:hypothetical protein